jgi:hypothetical protein
MCLYTVLAAKYRTLYFRWYVKYEQNEQFHHVGAVIIGNSLPPAGSPPPGNMFSCGLEPNTGNGGRFDTYAYWMGMSGVWGNYLINDNSLNVFPERWICVEVKFTLNEPATLANGELAVWWDGKQVCNKGNFRWRNTSTTGMDKFMLEHYNSDPNHAPFKGDVWFDDIVVATSYIGPVNTGPVSIPRPLSPAMMRGQWPKNMDAKDWLCDALGRRAVGNTANMRLLLAGKSVVLVR